MRHYCTLFDMNYLTKGLVMHESLLKHSSEDFTLHILSMDLESHRMIYELQLPNVQQMWLPNFEVSLNLSEMKSNRSWKEYCWTCGSNLMEYLMPWLGEVTYVDADLMFFSDPKIVHEEIGSRSIGITPHRFPERLKKMERNGRYNVAWVTGKPTSSGFKCIASWAKNCRDWCYARNEGDKFGDQRYLDTWETDFPGEVCSISNVGVNLAPWNSEQYSITEGPNVDGHPVVFYHLHEFQNPDKLTGYPISEGQRRHIYTPYIERWTAMTEKINALQQQMDEQRRLIEMEGQRA